MTGRKRKRKEKTAPMRKYLNFKKKGRGKITIGFFLLTVFVFFLLNKATLGRENEMVGNEGFLSFLKKREVLLTVFCGREIRSDTANLMREKSDLKIVWTKSPIAIRKRIRWAIMYKSIFIII